MAHENQVQCPNCHEWHNPIALLKELEQRTDTAIQDILERITFNEFKQDFELEDVNQNSLEGREYGELQNMAKRLQKLGHDVPANQGKEELIQDMLEVL